MPNNDYYGYFIREIFIPALNKTPLKAFHYAQQLLESDFMDEEKKKRIKLEKLKTIINIAYASVPFYKEKMKKAGLIPSDIKRFEDLNSFPTTTRLELNQNFPFKTLNVNAKYTLHRLSASSGTAQMPFRIAMNIDNVNRKYATKIHCFSNWGCPPGESFIRWMPFPNIMQDKNFQYGTKAISFLENKVVYPIIHRRKLIPQLFPKLKIHNDTVLENLYKWLIKQSSSFFEIYSVYAFLLARWMNKKSLKLPRIKGLNITGGITSPFMREEIEKVFPNTFRDYGTSETSLMAYECKYKSGMHTLDTEYHIELTKNGKAVESGQIGKITLTDLNNFLMPIIRVENGDLGHSIEKKCPCKRVTPLMECNGRTGNTLFFEDDSFVTEAQIFDIMYSIEGLEFFNIKENINNQLSVEILCKNKRKDTDIKRKIMEKLYQIIPIYYKININSVNCISSQSFSKKYRFVQSLAT